MDLVHRLLALEFATEELGVLLADESDELLVEVLAAEALDAHAGQYLDIVTVDVEDGRVERPAAEVVDQVLALQLGGRGARVVDRRRGGFIDEGVVAQVEAGLLGGVDGVDAGFVGEVRRNGDDHRVDLPVVGFEVLADLSEDERAEIARMPFLAMDLVDHAGVAHVAFELDEDLVVLGDAEHLLGFGADDDGPFAFEPDGGMGHEFVVLVLVDDGFAGIAQVGEQGRGRAEVDADDVGHGQSL